MVNAYKGSIKIVWRRANQVCPICKVEDSNCSYFDNTAVGTGNRYSCLTEVREHPLFDLRRYNNGFYIYSDKGDTSKVSLTELSTLKQYRDQPEAQEINAWYYKLIRKLSLSPKHAADLKKRGIDKETALKLGFRTLPANFKLDFENKLSGFKDNVSTNFNPVMLIPCYAEDAITTGYQLKTDSKKNKYIWGSGDYSAHNKAGKLPVSVARFTDSPISELWVTEGYLKATATAVKFNQVVFGCGGGTLDRTRELCDLVSEEHITKVVIFPDAGSANNAAIAQVNIRHFKALSKVCSNVYFGDYGQFNDKSVGDIDDQDTSLSFKLVGLDSYQPIKAIIEAITPSDDERSSGAVLQDYKGSFKPGNSYVVKDLTSAYESLVQQKVKIIHDCSATGAGKSHAVSNISLERMFTNLEDVSKGKLIYAVTSPRNPSITKIKTEFKLLEGRHDGLYQAEDGRLKTSENGGLFKPSNCKYNKLFQLARERGTPTTKICKGCDLKRHCLKSEGDGYGYRSNYIKAVASKKLVTNPTSIPINYVDEDTCIIIDEFTSVNSIQTIKFDLNILVGKSLQAKDAEMASFFSSINQNKTDGYFTKELYQIIKSSDILERLKKLAEFEANVILTNEEAISRLFLEKWKSGKNNGNYDLMKDANLTIEYAYFNNLYAALKDMKFSSFKKGNTLEISCVNEAIKNNAKLAGTIIVQDATTSTQEIADFFGVELSDVVSIQLATNKAITRNIHVTGLGKLTTSRSQLQIAAINTLREVIPAYLNLAVEDVGFIDYGRFAQGKDLTYFSTARGSNDFAAKKALVLIGTPLTNLGAALTRYEALKGKASSFEDERFKEFYKHKTNEEALQAIGRLRASRRLDESLTVVVLGDADLPCLGNMERIQACDIEPTIKTRNALVDKRIKEAQDYLATNGKPTQEELALFFNISTSALVKWVKRHFDSWSVFMDSLIVQFDGFQGQDETEIVNTVQAMEFLAFQNMLRTIEYNLTTEQKRLAYMRLELLREIAIHSIQE